MEQLWKRPKYAGLMALSMLSLEAQASHDSGYAMHRLERAHEIMRHNKRDAVCNANWSLCPGTVGGGCCPNGYECGTSSCTLATAGPTTACGMANWYNCPREESAGCCPLGTICGRERKCIKPDGSFYPVEECPADYYSCPFAQGGGCCANGMGCARDRCYSTSSTTAIVTGETTTTDSNGDTVTTPVTETTVRVPGAGPDTSNLVTGDFLVVATIMPKSHSTESDSQGSGGLTQAQLGGIVAAVVIVLLAVTVATFIILRRLKKTRKAVEIAESRRDTSSGQERSQKSSFGQPTVTEVDGLDGGPFVHSPSIRPSNARSRSDTSFTERSPNRTPNLPSTSSTPPVWAGQFHAAPPISEAPSEGRDHSIDSSNGYYDVSRYSQQTSVFPRGSYDSQLPYGHVRHNSETSELSSEAVDGPGKSELDSTAVDVYEANRRRASTSPSVRPTGHVRRSSGGAARGRSESAGGALPLSTVTEFTELHGYYGPPEGAVGQTAERLEHQKSTTSSTISRAFMEKEARLRRGDSSVSATPTEAYRKDGGPS